MTIRSGGRPRDDRAPQAHPYDPDAYATDVLPPMVEPARRGGRNGRGGSGSGVVGIVKFLVFAIVLAHRSSSSSRSPPCVPSSTARS